MVNMLELQEKYLNVVSEKRDFNFSFTHPHLLTYPYLLESGESGESGERR
jgi:hypothetical protein